MAVYSVLRSVIGKAYRDGILPSNPTEEFKVSDYVKGTETERAYLELEELKKFAAVETRHLLEKQAFVFSCICGLRVSDVRKLTWGDIRWATTTRLKSVKRRLVTGCPIPCRLKFSTGFPNVPTKFRLQILSSLL